MLLDLLLGCVLGILIHGFESRIGSAVPVVFGALLARQGNFF